MNSKVFFYPDRLLFICLIFALLLKAQISHADYVYGPVNLGTIPVSVNIIDMPEIIVQKPNTLNAWYDETIQLNEQSNGKYSVSLPIEVLVKSDNKFNISRVNDLILQHENNPSLQFQTEAVNWISSQNQIYPLTNTPLTLPLTSVTNNIASDIFNLEVVAKPPSVPTGGLMWDNAGNYFGTLTLLIEYVP